MTSDPEDMCDGVRQVIDEIVRQEKGGGDCWWMLNSEAYSCWGTTTPSW